MTKREKIIVVIMCLAIAGGAYDLMSRGRTTSSKAIIKPVKSSQELKTFVADVAGKLISEQVSKEQQYMINQAGAQWNKDPFIYSSIPLKKRPFSTTPKKQPVIATSLPKFIYSGFIELGKNKIAIINGMEYSVGEKLPDKSFFVKSISSRRVVIGKTDGSETIQVPLSENVFSYGM